jgi:drug/metabolite transporter (DMT)-like permease
MAPDIKVFSMVVDKKKKYAALAGAFCVMLLACIDVSYTQLLGGAVPKVELNAMRFGTQILFNLPFVLKHRCQVSIPRNFWKVMIIFIIANNGSNICRYSAVTYLPLGTFAGLNYSIIIACNAIVFRCTKSEKNMKVLIVAVLICILGVLFLTQPLEIFSLWGLYRHRHKLEN